MKFDEKHPAVVVKFHATNPKPTTAEWHAAMEPEDCLVYAGYPQQCSKSMGGCGEQTFWLDIGWGVDVPCCSDECRQAMWDGYAKAVSEPVIVCEGPIDTIGFKDAIAVVNPVVVSGTAIFTGIEKAEPPTQTTACGCYGMEMTGNQHTSECFEYALEQHKATTRHSFIQDSTHPRMPGQCDYTYPDGDYCARFPDDPLHAEQEPQKEDIALT